MSILPAWSHLALSLLLTMGEVLNPQVVLESLPGQRSWAVFQPSNPCGLPAVALLLRHYLAFLCLQKSLYLRQHRQ